MQVFAASVVVTIIAGLAVSHVPFVVVATLAAAALGLVILQRPHRSVYALIALGVTALPVQIPYGLSLGDRTYWLYEPFLVVAAAWAIGHGIPRSTAWVLGVFAALIAGWALFGLYNQETPSRIVTDLRGPAEALLAFAVGVGAMHSAHRRDFLKAVRWSLWVSATMSVLSSATGLRLSGVEEAAALFLERTGGQVATVTSSVRLLTPATHFALAVLCGTLALVVSGRLSVRRGLTYLAPAALITLLSFSRNSVLACAAAVLFAVCIDHSPRLFGSTVKVVLAGGFAAVLVLMANAALRLPGADWAGNQTSAYNDRVVSGLSPQTRAVDASAEARDVENRFARAAIIQAPIVGHGYGYAYRPPAGELGSFTADNGRYYLHNYYYWTWIKSGLIGLVLYLWVAVRPVLLSLRVRTSASVALGSTAAALSLVNFVAPLPLAPGSGGSVTFGVVLGALSATVLVRQPKDGVLVRAPKGDRSRLAESERARG